ncbi:MAG: glutathione S-transferase N-terminal domain-containing protein [Gammaproteobacteria bacterium]|nr:glutathione S-transferase N-terminal domain-containing protein [Gammaproteobacteria bacterium]MBU1624264.1 glutathione S-transferase N-terminal domain-containing protein [Gammaproteobacteria bacterium]MBU1981992.1 glutathione S-transferase N-terminal domain-containing protein [Gammaproteobacteria bacterium]
MRTLIRMFFRTLRLVLMPFMLLWAKLAMPKGVVRSAEAQQKVEAECLQLALYHFKTCPFCIKVRHEMGRLSLPITLRDAQHDAEHKAALLQGGGKVQTPCLRITGEDGQVQWMYESGDIIDYLQHRFA